MARERLARELTGDKIGEAETGYIMLKEYSDLINGVKYQQLRNNDFKYLKDMFKTYAVMNLPQTDIIVDRKSCRASMVDLYNKCFQLNETGFKTYIETKLPKKDFIAVLKQI